MTLYTTADTSLQAERELLDILVKELFYTTGPPDYTIRYYEVEIEVREVVREIPLNQVGVNIGKEAFNHNKGKGKIEK